jgi:hypothetical protein
VGTGSKTMGTGPTGPDRFRFRPVPNRSKFKFKFELKKRKNLTKFSKILQGV